MYYTYVIKSTLNGECYKGYSKYPETRLRNHNAGKTTSTRHGIPWILVYTEVHKTLEEALKREKFLKTAAGRRFIKSLNL